MFLKGKRGLIYGVRNDRSLAWGCVQSVVREGATVALAYFGEREEKDVSNLAASLTPNGETMIHPCDLTDPEQVAALHAAVKAKLGGIDFMVHAVAFAHKKDLMGSYADTSNEGFADAMDKSVYTFVTASRAAAQLLPEDGTGGSFITLSYIGGERVVPNYNVMGVAKAALESTTRYLAYDLGSKKIRVNAISAGPTMTLSARGISGFVDMYKRAAQAAPLGVNTTIDQVGDTCAFLVSDLARGITGDVIYVDNGLHIMAYAQ